MIDNRHNTVTRLLLKSGTFLLFLFFPLSFVHAQQSTVAAEKIKAVFLFNFTRFIDWPPHSFDSDEAPFVIGVIGSNSFVRYIDESVAGEKVGTHPIVVEQFKDARDIRKCHILYINLSDERKIKEAIMAISGRGILTVSDNEDFGKLGGIIRFYTEKNKIRLEINTEAAKTAQLTISSKLLSVAKTY